MESLLVRPPEAAKILGLSRTVLYEHIASGSLPSLKIGAARLIEVDALRAWVERQRANTAAGRSPR